MPLVAPTVGLYPSIDDVFEQARIHIDNIRDGATSFAGESRVAADPWTPSIRYLNIAMLTLQRDLEQYGYPATREVTFIVNGLPPINGPLGLGIPDPTVQVYLGFTGFWDGSTLHSSPVLPPDLLNPIEIKQRVTNSSTVFTLVQQAGNDLPSVLQNYLLGWWIWRQDRLYFNGAQQEMDIELRYTGGVPKYSVNLNPDLWPTTLIPFLDSGEALAYKCAQIWAAPRAAAMPQAVAYLEGMYRSAMLLMANRWIKTMQRSRFQRQDFGGEGGIQMGGEGWT